MEASLHDCRRRELPDLAEGPQNRLGRALVSLPLAQAGNPAAPGPLTARGSAWRPS